MKEREIEKLAREYAFKIYPFPHITNYMFPSDLQKSIIIGYKAALSNPDYILIEKEYINSKLQELKDSNKAIFEQRKQIYEEYKDKECLNELLFNNSSFYHVQLEKIRLIEDILSNSKTK